LSTILTVVHIGVWDSCAHSARPSRTVFASLPTSGRGDGALSQHALRLAQQWNGWW